MAQIIDGKKISAQIREEIAAEVAQMKAEGTAGISIPAMFLMEGYLSRYGLADWAKMRYEGLGKTASDCIECGVCETRCPYNLPIREMLKKSAEGFGG